MSTGFACPLEEHLIELAAKDGATGCEVQILGGGRTVLEGQKSTRDPVVHDRGEVNVEQRDRLAGQSATAHLIPREALLVEERNSASGACKQVGQVSPGGAGTDHNRIVCRHTGFLLSRMPEARDALCPAHSQAAMQWKPSVGCRDYWLSTHDRVRTYHVGTVGFACTVWLWNRHIQDSRMARQAFDV